MEYAEHLNFANPWLVKVDDVLLNLNAAAAGEAVVPWPPGLGVLRQHFQRLVDRGSVVRLLALSPRTPRVQQNIIHVPEG